MSHPKRKDLFDAWAKAMVAGATVDKPNYSPVKGARKSRSGTTSSKRKRKKNNKRRKRVRKD